VLLGDPRVFRGSFSGFSPADLTKYSTSHIETIAGKPCECVIHGDLHGTSMLMSTPASTRQRKQFFGLARCRLSGESDDWREPGEGIGQGTIPVRGGVLVAQSRRGAGVTGAVHQLCRGCTGSRRPRES
jgi:hypothetical protein